MTDITSGQVLAALSRLSLPGSQTDIVAGGLVSDIFISDGKVYFSITVPAEQARELEPLRAAAEKAVKALSGVRGAVVSLTADRRAAGNAPAARPAPAAARPGQAAQTGTAAKPGLPGIGAIIAVASGKGGVGKSTTAVNLALALQANGLKVGLLDADIYGPSLPRLMGISGRPKQIDGRIIVPMENYGLKVMSMGFLVDEEAAMIWRGPMVQSALLQMLREVAWGELDILVVDMPPGTGDVQLTMAQQVPLAGAVIVSTPQDLALIDARKGITMFNKVQVPVLGIVENMSYFIAPDTGRRYDIFGHGGARAEAVRIGAPFLGEVPLTMTIRELSDAGRPIVVAEPDSEQAKTYRAIAERVQAALTGRKMPPPPAITFE